MKSNPLCIRNQAWDALAKMLLQGALLAPLPKHASLPNQSDNWDRLFEHRCAFLMLLAWIPIQKRLKKIIWQLKTNSIFEVKQRGLK